MPPWLQPCGHDAADRWLLKDDTGGSKNPNPRNPRNPPKFAKSSVFNRPIVSATCLNQQRQPPTLSGWHTWIVDEIEVASIDLKLLSASVHMKG